MPIQDLTIVLRWWLTFFLLGLISFPLSSLIFKKFIDGGYGLSKTLSLIVISYIAFLLGVTHLAPFSNGVLYFISTAFLLFNLYLFLKNKKEEVVLFKKNIKFIFLQEGIFTFGLFLWTYVRAHQPEIRGLEKFMDFGFINSVLRSDYLPPMDMWFAGKPINYYWFGHFTVAVATKLSGLPSGITYNFMLATIVGLTLSTAFSISATLMKSVVKEKKLRYILAAGIISSILLTFAGNFHTPFYVLKNGSQKYWYPDATRFIGYNPETNDKTIHEFPIYSFVVADLHPHLINLPYVLLYLAILWKVVAEKERRKLALKNLLLLGFLLGIFFMTSTWDFANYALVAGAVIGIKHLNDEKFNFPSILRVGIWLIIVVGFGLLIASPFILNFESIAQGVRLVHSRSPLWQLAILWGFPALMTIVFVHTLSKLKQKVETADLFIFSINMASWILIILPEIVYVKDIYIATHYRANTMFKLTYQAYVMFYLSSGYISIRLLQLTKNSFYKKLYAAILFMIFISILSYANFAVNSYYGELKVYQGLSGIEWLKRDYPNEYGVTEWLKENVKGQPVILEAPGDSYTDFNVISSYTGLPTVSGWFVHEWLWRGDAKYPQERVTDIVEVYTSPNVELTKSLLKKYNVGYVIVGTFERQKYPNLDEAKFEKLGTQVFFSGNTKIYQVY